MAETDDLYHTPGAKTRQTPPPLYSRPELAPLDKDALSALGSLPLRARLLADSHGVGGHASRRKGSSIEFADYRDYQMGDDLRRVDWRLYGRTDRLHVRETYEETPLRTVLLLDVSNSMAYTSRPGKLTKLDFARALLGAVALLVRRQHDSCGVGLLGRELEEWMPPSSSPARIQALWELLDRPKPSHTTSLARALDQALEVTPARSLFVLASDFYEEPEVLGPVIRRLRYERHDLLTFYVSDPAEADFQFNEPTEFLDVETGSSLAADPAALAEIYRKRFSAHQSAICELCTANGFDALTLRTDELPMEALRAFLSRRDTHRRT
ncbi:MAG: DUF58 domain-containing protein [Nibricoccus sp.]